MVYDMRDALKCNDKMYLVLNDLLKQVNRYSNDGNTYDNVIHYQYLTYSHLQIYSEIVRQWFNKYEFLKEYFELEITPSIYDLKIYMKEEYFNEETLDNIITVMRIKGMIEE